MIEDEETVFLSVEKKIRELEIEQEIYERDVSQFYKDLEFSQEEVRSILENPDLFSPEELAHMEKIRQEIEQDIEQVLEQPKNLKKRQEESKKKPPPPYALFI